jgi:thiamine pyrophosphate-dependent acetolactate synthase large subunit-like protein
MSKDLYRTLGLLASGKLARRDFMTAITALGLTTGSAESLFASFRQDGPGPVANDPIKVAEGPAGAVLLEQMKAMGLKYIFNTNTSGLSPMMDAIDTNEVQVIMIPQEGLATSVTHGYALAGGAMPFFTGNKVGVGHTMSNLYNAWKDRTPMLVTFGASGLRGRAGKDGFQEWDEHLQPTELFTSWHWSCIDARTMPEVLRRAFKFAHTPPGAPVTLDFPPDLLGEKISAPIFRMDPNDVRPVFRSGPGLVEKAARWLAEAKSPVFIVGPEVSRGKVNRAMIALAEKLGVPVCQEDDLFCDFPNRHPLFLGSYDTRRFPRTPVDLVINFGAKIDGITKGARLVHVSTDSDSIGRSSEVDLPVLAHVSTFIADLSAAIDSLLTADRISRIRAERAAATAAYTAQLWQARQESLRFQFDQAPLSWDRVGHELERVLDKNAVIVPELGPTAGNKVLGYLTQGIDDKLRIGRTTGSALGWGVGAAFGVQLALPDRQVVSIQGDGGILFGQTEMLWTISRYDAPLLIVIMNNYSYNETRSRNLTSGGRQFQTGRELTSYLGDPKVDFSKIAEAYSIKGEKVKTPADLVAGLQRALRTMKDGRPYLLDVEVAPDSIMGDSTWHPNFSIAQLGNRRKNSSWGVSN